MASRKVPIYNECMALIASALYAREHDAGHPYSTADSIAYYEAITRLGKATWDVCPPLHKMAGPLRICPA